MISTYALLAAIWFSACSGAAIGFILAGIIASGKETT